MTALCITSLFHDWRLIEEEPTSRPLTEAERASRQVGPTVHTGETTRRWYCTRCRLVEETVLPQLSSEVPS